MKINVKIFIMERQPQYGYRLEYRLEFSQRLA